MADQLWAALTNDLDRLLRDGRRVRFWLRDDDAVRPTPALDRLLFLIARFKIPLLLAVIPKNADRTLRDALSAHPLVSPCQHGFSHRNHAPSGERAQELGLHRPMDSVLAELGEGRRILQDLFGDALDDALVPPWNRMDDGLLPYLSRLGFTALSRFGASAVSTVNGLSIVNSTLDIIDWKNGKRGRSDDDMIGKMRAQLCEPDTGDVTLGVLTHHLDHDDQAWSFLERLMEATRSPPDISWLSLADAARAAHSDDSTPSSNNLAISASS